MNHTDVSVVMAVYNGEKYVKEAIDSILTQTFRDFEFIIVDDASTDRTPEILSNYTDSRITIIRNEKNQKLGASLNRGIAQAKGRYIIRMDADDISAPSRIKKQVEFMENNPDIAVSWGKGFRYQNGNIQKRIQTLPRKDSFVKAHLLFLNPIMHNCCIIRRELFEHLHYNPQFTISEDFNLWLRASKDYRFQGQNAYLIQYRIHDDQATASSRQKEQRQQLYQNLLAHFTRLGMQISKKDLDFHVKLVYGSKKADTEQLQEWLRTLKEENRRTKSYPAGAFHAALLWKAGELRRTHRISFPVFIMLCARISPVGAITGLFRKIGFAVSDDLAQKRSDF